MQFNVATLLQEPVGSRRHGRLDRELLSVPEAGWTGVASGDVELMRSARGVLVQARLTVRPVLECARCLEPFEQELEVAIDDEFAASRDPITGEPVEVDTDDFEIDERHQLDLSEAVRQYEQTAIPLQPICRPGCAGLCPQCGRDLEEAPCDCRSAVAVPPWEALTALGEQLRAEESDGATEA